MGYNYGQDSVSHVDDDTNQAKPSKGMRSKTNPVFESGLKIGLDTKEKEPVPDGSVWHRLAGWLAGLI